MNQILYTHLINLAQNDGLTSYRRIAPLVGLSMDVEADRDEMTRLLEEIARHEEQAGRPMLTAIVVHEGGDNLPGEGFFVIATEFRRFGGSRGSLDRLCFWVEEVKKVQDHW